MLRNTVVVSILACQQATGDRLQRTPSTKKYIYKNNQIGLLTDCIKKCSTLKKSPHAVELRTDLERFRLPVKTSLITSIHIFNLQSFDGLTHMFITSTE